MGIFQDDPTECAEDKMGDAMGCIALAVIGAILIVAWIIFITVRAVL